MAVAIVAGVIAGFIGFVPLFMSLRLSRKHPSASVANAALYGLGGVCVSLVIAAALLIACAMLARAYVLPFGIAEIAALVLSTAVYVARQNAPSK